MAPMTSRQQRPSQVRPRPASTGRAAPARRAGSRPPAPGRLAPHRNIARGPGLPIYTRVLLVLAVIGLGGLVLLAAMGVVGKVVVGLGSAFSGAISRVVATPSPSPSPLIVPNAPTLSVPTQQYTNQPTIDLSGLVPGSFVGQSGVTIRIYRALAGKPPTLLIEVPVGTTPGFTVPALTLVKGRNDFTATLFGPGGESPRSKPVTYVLDTSAPKVKILSPAPDTVVNGATVTIRGQTQAHSALVARNEANNASITGTAADDGTFSLVLPIDSGPNGIRISATDPAGNQGQTVINILRGSGKLAARLTASQYRFAVGRLPTNVTLAVHVTDPDGRPVEAASVTFTLTIPGVGPITQALTTDATGAATWKTTIPIGATAGQGNAAVLVDAGTLGTTTAQTVLTITP